MAGARPSSHREVATWRGGQLLAVWSPSQRRHNRPLPLRGPGARTRPFPEWSANNRAHSASAVPSLMQELIQPLFMSISASRSVLRLAAFESRDAVAGEGILTCPGHAAGPLPMQTHRLVPDAWAIEDLDLACLSVGRRAWKPPPQARRISW